MRSVVASMAASSEADILAYKQVRVARAPATVKTVLLTNYNAGMA
jgi:hypothetical protein